MSVVNPFSSFPDVDSAASPATLVNYLQAVSSLEVVRVYKQATYTLLAPRPGERVLDVGCGAGDDAIVLAERTPEAVFFGVDISRTMIAEARRQAACRQVRVEFHDCDARRLPFPDAQFHACRVDRVLQHLDQPVDALLEISRVTRVGGRVVASEPDWDTLTIDVPDRRLARKIVHFHTDSVRQGWIGRQLPSLFRQAALSDISVEGQTLCLTDPFLADQMTGIGAAASNAAAAGIITAAEAVAWSSHLAEAGRNRAFFCALTGYIVKGRK